VTRARRGAQAIGQPSFSAADNAASTMAMAARSQAGPQLLT
jgi:hypothetical protein